MINARVWLYAGELAYMGESLIIVTASSILDVHRWPETVKGYLNK